MKKSLLLIALSLIIFLKTNAQSSITFTPQKIGKFSHEWDPNSNDWYVEDSSSYTYNASNQLIEEITYYGDYPFTGVWTPGSKIATTYNNNGAFSEKIWLSYNGNSWDTTYKNTYTYNANNKLINILSEQYTLTGWEVYARDTTSYDNNGNKILEELQIWDTISNTWTYAQGSQKHTYTYDVNNYLITKLTENWNTNNSGFENINQYLFTNNSNGLPFETLFQIWSSVNWYDMDKDSSIYDANSKIIENYRRYRHTGGMDQWGMTYKETFTYSASGKLSEFLSQTYNLTSNIYENGGRIESFYNSDDNLVKEWEQNWDTLTTSYKIAKETLHYYSIDTATVSIKNNKPNKFHIYPNPCKNQLFIQTDLASNENCKVFIYDITGKELTSNTFNKNTNTTILNTENLVQGVYFIKIESSNKNHTEKFIKLE